MEDRRNCLLIMPSQTGSPKFMPSLQAALKSAIQVCFQLEESELAAEPLPTRKNRNLLLFYESAEGGAGALRRLLEGPGLGVKLPEPRWRSATSTRIPAKTRNMHLTPPRPAMPPATTA